MKVLVRGTELVVELPPSEEDRIDGPGCHREAVKHAGPNGHDAHGVTLVLDVLEVG